MSEQSWKVLPGSRLGRWSLGLIILMPILFVIGTSFSSSLYQSVPAGSSFIADLTARPLLALTMLVGAAAGVGGFITGLLAIIKIKEKAILVYLSTLIGGLLSFYLVGLLLFPD